MRSTYIRVHPLFYLIGIVYTLMGSGLIFLSYFLSVILHECAHARMARLRGYKLGRIVLMPYGAVLKGGEDMPRVDSVLIAIFGPLINLMMALIIVALWWLVPSLYAYTEYLMWANLSLALFNLLPVFPLDGARVILAMSKSRARTLKRLRICGAVLSIVLLALMIASVFFSFNISLGIMALFIMHGAISGTDKELYSHILSSTPFVKSTIYVLQYLDIGVNYKTSLYRLLEEVKEDRLITFHILDDDLKELAVMGERELKDIVIKYPLATKICDTTLIT